MSVIQQKAAQQRGRFITFEGIDGCGKSTQIQRLARQLELDGRKVLAAREPGGTALGESVRRILRRSGEEISAEAEMFLFAACRAQLVRNVINPALENGVWVVLDRYLDSSLSYQGYGRALGVDLVRRINEPAVAGVRPDLTILLDLPFAVAKKRRGWRRADRIEREQQEFHERVRQGYLAIAAQEPQRWRIFDATLERGELFQLIWAELKRRLAC